MFKILVVEDQPHNLRLMEQILSDISSEVEVFTAKNGEEALEKVLHDVYHIILMDIALPGMDGIETTKRIREINNCRNTPIIAISAHAMYDDTLIFEQVFDAYISKPIDEEKLLFVLEKWMGDQYNEQ